MFIGYHILIKFFENGDPQNDYCPEDYAYHEKNAIEGDLQGITQRLDYLRDLGIDLIHLGPIFKARTTHGYDTTDYFQLAEHLSARDRNEAENVFRTLLDEAHRREIRVILDLVLNHASKSYEKSSIPPEFSPQTEPPQTPQERKWSSFQFWNLNDQSTREFLLHVGAYWLQNFNIDGYRLDHALGVPADFWVEFYRRMKAINPRVILLGEVWEDMRPGVDEMALIRQFRDVAGAYQFTSLYDFPLLSAIEDTFIHQRRTLPELYHLIVQMNQLNDAHFQMTNFVETHDIPRLMDRCQDRLVFRQVMGLLMALNGNIMLEYANELAPSGDRQVRFKSESGRIAMRFPETWQDGDRAMFGYVRKLIHLRQSRPELFRGSYHLVQADERQLIFDKRDGSNSTRVALLLIGHELPFPGRYYDLIGEQEWDNMTGMPAGIYFLEKTQF